MTTEEVEKILDDTAARLAEHFDAVQLLVSWTEDATTYGMSRGRGDWYARHGLCQEFINRAKERQPE